MRPINLSDANMSPTTKRAISRIARRAHSRRAAIEKPGPVTIYDMRTTDQVEADVRRKQAEQGA